MVSAFLDALLAMNQEIVPESSLADGPAGALWRRVRGVEERARYMIGDRDEALQPIPADDEKPGFRRYDQARAARPRAGHRALELSLSHRRQHGRARR